MNNYALVSIVVPIYKAEQYLDECVKSLVKQTYTDLEIILVDDGSPDNCPSIADAWALQDRRIKVVHKANGGPSEARNAGMSVASGKWLLFIDADDVVPTHFVEELVSASCQSTVLAVSSVIRFQDALPPAKSGATTKPCSKDLAAVRGGRYACGILYCRELVNSIDLQFDKALHNVEDVVWNGIYLRYVSEIVYVDVPYFYRMNPSSITSKCVDYKWQVASWIAARRSLMNWFENKPLTPAQRKEAAGMYRHCQNNIHAECLAGSIPYSTLKELESREDAEFCQSLVPVPERLFRKYLPRLYFSVYTGLLRAKNVMHK